MRYRGCAFGAERDLAVEKEGLRIGSRFLDYADLRSLRPVNYRVRIETLGGEEIELSMLGRAFDGFWEELSACFAERSREALFVEETPLMRCEGEYVLPGESGRAEIALFPDAVCVFPQSCRALRIPLCFTEELRLEGYLLQLRLRTGACCTVGRMGYDTLPFAERAQRAAELVKKQRAQAIRALPTREPFTEKGLFRTSQPAQYWNAAFGTGRCAIEFFTGEDAATYLYRFREPKEDFLLRLEEAMEAVGTHREIIYWTDRQIGERPLYRMAVARSEAVRFLRERTEGRLIHSANHAARLRDFLEA